MSTEKMTELAKEFLYEAKEQLDHDFPMQTKILNVAFLLGKFFGISEILFETDLDAYVKLAEETKEDRDMLMGFQENIYKMK